MRSYPLQHHIAGFTVHLQQGYVKPTKTKAPIMPPKGPTPIASVSTSSAWECHKQYHGMAKPKREMYIDDIIPDGI